MLLKGYNQETVLSVHHWTDRLFSFTTTRDPTFRFRSGEFTMIGITVNEKPLLRAYSVASAHYDDRLEFLSIKVPDGPLTSRLQHLKVGDPVIVGRKSTGTLVIDNLEAGRNLYLLGTGHRPGAVPERDPGTPIPMTGSRRWFWSMAAAWSRTGLRRPDQRDAAE